MPLVHRIIWKHRCMHASLEHLGVVTYYFSFVFSVVYVFDVILLSLSPERYMLRLFCLCLLEANLFIIIIIFMITPITKLLCPGPGLGQRREYQHTVPSARVRGPDTVLLPREGILRQKEGSDPGRHRGVERQILARRGRLERRRTVPS